MPLLLKGDAGRLRQIITNLIGNAIKFSDKGTVSLNIRKESEDELKTTLCFLIRDNGIGIEADKLETIFELFTQADSSTTRNYGGTGLGLTISRQLAELMGGTVGVESVVGEGSTFWFSILLEKQSKTTPDATIAHPPIRPGKRGSEYVRILLAEDDLTNQLVTKSILLKFGYQVDVACNGKEALWFLKYNNYALVLMDCMMPVMNGYDTTKIIRDISSDVRDHTIPVIALTANTMHEDRVSCLASGMNDFLSKPLEFNELLSMLNKWLPYGSAQSMAPRVVEDRREKPFIPTIEIFHRDDFVHRNLEDLELSRDVARIFIKSVPEYLESIHNALAENDADALRRSAHKLKGAAANLSLPLLSESAGMLESIAKVGDLVTARQQLNNLEQKLKQAVETLGKMLISHQGRTQP